MAARRILFLLLLPWLGLLPWPGALGGVVAEPPACTAVESGSVACIAGRLCLCGYYRGGSTTDQPAGYHWDCGVRRPDCHRPPTSAPRHDLLDDLRPIVPVAPVRSRTPAKQRP